MQFTQPLHRALQQYPDRIATIYGDRRRTYRQLADRVARLAGALQGLGMAPGDRVAMLALNSDRYWEYVVAVLWGGGVINPCNTRWSAAEILYSLEDSGSNILLIDDRFLPYLTEIRARRDGITIIYVGDGATPAGALDYEQLIRDAEPVPDAMRRDGDLIGIFYTGGTTGTPKGVMLSHTGFMSSAMALIAEGITTPNGVFLHVAPMFHLADLAVGCVNWITGNTHAFSPVFCALSIIDIVETERVTDMLLVPTMIQMLVDHPEITNGRDLSSIRTVAYGGSAIPEAVIERALAALPNTRFYQCYGMTELSPVACVLGAQYHTAEGRRLGKLRSGGKANLISEIRIVDPDGNEVPTGETGEVVVRGPHVMLGYWNKPEQTADAVRDGWMHTGDAGYLDAEGFVFIVDRLKDMIISGGENVYSAEVENALSQHPAVMTVAVIGIPDRKWGEGVHAFVITKPGQSVTTEALIAHCRTLIAGYKCPRSLEFVSELPLSGPGKVLKTELRKRFWDDQDRKVS